MSLEVRVLELEETVEVADRVHPSKIDPSACVHERERERERPSEHVSACICVVCMVSMYERESVQNTYVHVGQPAKTGYNLSKIVPQWEANDKPSP